MIKKTGIALLAAAIVLAGCSTTLPVRNVADAPVQSNLARVTQDDVQRAILRAGAQYGWQMTPKQPGLIEGTLNLRRHMAKVNIRFDEKTYSITYADSVELQYDGANIHKNYNGWIQNLDNAIQVQLKTL